jgi:hypothetical protein
MSALGRSRGCGTSLDCPLGATNGRRGLGWASESDRESDGEDRDQGFHIHQKIYKETITRVALTSGGFLGRNLAHRKV